MKENERAWDTLPSQLLTKCLALMAQPKLAKGLIAHAPLLQ